MRHIPNTHIRNKFCALLTLTALLSGSAFYSCSQEPGETNLKFDISFSESVSNEPLTGRMFLAFARNDDSEPRSQVRRDGVQFFGVDFENLQPGEKVTIDGSTLGYPYENLADLPAGE